MASLFLDTYSTPQDAGWAPVATPVGLVITSDIPLGTFSDHGSLRVEDGILYYKPDPGFTGTDRFSFEGLDGTETHAVTVEIEVSLPEAQPQTYYDPRVAPELPTSEMSIVLSPVATFPRIDGANQRFNGFDYAENGRIFASTDGREDGEGLIYELIPNGDGTFETELWFDVGAAVFAATGLEIDNANAIFGGLRGIAFHPEFATNGKFYVSMMHQIPADQSASTYIGPIYSGGDKQNGDSVVAEFTVDTATGEVISDSYRELFRVSVPVDDHPIRQIEFNKFAEPGDEDYGLLYIAHGDGSIQSATSGGGLRNDALGKILRIDPLQNGDDPYGIPDTNPFVDTDEMPDEVYAIGFRNPHTLAFSQDDSGEVHLFVADVGRDNAEEINKVVAGGNYGWSTVEGIFSLNTNPGTLIGVEPLTPEDTEYAIAEQVIFPATFIGHFGFIEFDENGVPIDGQVGGGQAIASGHAISTESVLNGLFIFGDFAKGGRFYEADLEALLSVNSQIPLGGTIQDVDWVTPAHMPVLFDHDGDPDTTPLLYSSILDAIGRTRSDIRFNQGPNGEMYITTKQDGTVYVVANALPDYNDVIFGTDGPDDLFAYGGDDRIFGENGDDIIRFSDGEDTATGGLGADVFVLSTAGGVDTVTDFQVGYDSVDVSAWTDLGISIVEQVSGDDIELVRTDTNAVVARLLGAAVGGNAGPVAQSDRFDVLDGDLAAAGAAGVAVSATSILANDGDRDSDVFSLTAVAGSAANIGAWVAGSDGGLFRISATGEVDFADAGGPPLQPGDTTQITYTISDAEGATDTASVIVRIDATPIENAAPVAVDDLFLAPQSTAGAYTRLGAVRDDTTLLSNDFDPDGDPLRIVAIDGNGFDVSVAGANVWFAGDNGGEFRVFDTGVIDFRFDASEFVAGETTGFDYSILDSFDANGIGRVDVIWGGYANDDVYQISAGELAAAGPGLIVLGRTSTDTDALENDVPGAAVVAVGGSEAGLGAWVAGDNGGEFRVFDSGVVQFRNQGTSVELGDVTRVEYTIAAEGISGDTLTAMIEVIIGEIPTDTAVDDVYLLSAAALTEAGSAWFRLGALNTDTDLLQNDLDTIAVTGINGDPLQEGVFFDGDNGGQFRVFDSGVVDFRNQGDLLEAGESTSFTYTAIAADGSLDMATVTLTVDDFVLV